MPIETTFREAQAILAGAGVRFDTGLKSDEFARIEQSYELCFPPDLREFLSTALPVSENWLDWRGADDKQIRDALNWPFEGICFDIEHNAFWLDVWGPRPHRLLDAFEVARCAIATAPKLIPICGHRYLPATPCEAGNPVFSVYQTDSIYYGANLIDYLHNEYREAFGHRGYGPSHTPRRIEFWAQFEE